MEEVILSFADTPWVLLLLLAVAIIDGFFPPIPSESIVIALAVLSMSTGNPPLYLIIPIAAVGAFVGDSIAYLIGKKIRIERFLFFRRPRVVTAFAFARRSIFNRGGTLLLSARYIPVGRVAVNMTAGSVGFPYKRFALLDSIASVTWAVYSTIIGIAAGAWLGDNPLIAMVCGVVFGVIMGFIVDQVISFFRKRREQKQKERGEIADEPADAADPAIDRDVDVEHASTALAGAGPEHGDHESSGHGAP